MDKKELIGYIKVLADKSTKTQKAVDALQLSQAALNLANVHACLENTAQKSTT